MRQQQKDSSSCKVKIFTYLSLAFRKFYQEIQLYEAGGKYI